MTNYSIYAKVIGSKNLPKGNYTLWVGTTPIGFAKKGNMNLDKVKGYMSAVSWSMSCQNEYPRSSIEFIIKLHKALGGEIETGRIQLPLVWFPVNQVVTDWFPVYSKTTKGTDGKKMMLQIAIHVATAKVQPFSAPVGYLLVLPAWDRPGIPAVPPQMQGIPLASTPPPQQLQQPPQPYPTMQPGYVQPNQPIQPGYVQPNQPMQPGYVQPNQPIQPGYVQPNQPMQPGYVQPYPTMQPGYVQPNQPMQPGYMPDNAYSQPSGPTPNQPGYVQPPTVTPVISSLTPSDYSASQSQSFPGYPSQDSITPVYMPPPLDENPYTSSSSIAPDNPYAQNQFDNAPYPTNNLPNSSSGSMIAQNPQPAQIPPNQGMYPTVPTLK